MRIDLPVPPPLEMPLPPAIEPAPAVEPDEEPLAGPARLFVGKPRAVEPAAVRPAGFSGRMDADPEPEPSPDDWESRLRWTGLDRSARTVAEDVDGRRARERRERERGRPERSEWDAMAAAPRPPVAAVLAPRMATPTPPPEDDEPEPITLRVHPPEPRVPQPPPTAAAPSPLERRLTRGAAARQAEREALSAPPRDVVSHAAEDSFFEPPPADPEPTPPSMPAPRQPNRRLSASFPDEAGAPRPAAGKFVPRNQRAGSEPRPVPAWVWGVAGLLLVGGGGYALWSQIRDDVMPDPTVPGDVRLPARVPESPATPPAPDAAVEPDAPVATTAVVTPPADPPAEPVRPPTAPVEVPVPAPEPPVVTPPRADKPVVVAPTAKTAELPIGSLRIVTNRAARVKIDGRAYGNVEANEDYDLPVGEHAVQLVPTRGGRAQTITTRVDEGRATLLRFDFK